MPQEAPEVFTPEPITDCCQTRLCPVVPDLQPFSSSQMPSSPSTGSCCSMTCSRGHVNSAENRFCTCCGELLSLSPSVLSSTPAEEKAEQGRGKHQYKEGIQAFPLEGTLCIHYAKLLRQRQELVRTAGQSYSIECSKGHKNPVENRFCIHCGEFLSLSPDRVSNNLF